MVSQVSCDVTKVEILAHNCGQQRIIYWAKILLLQARLRIKKINNNKPKN